MFLLGASDTYLVKSMGGSATHTQTEDEVASHEHNVVAPNYGQVLYGGSGTLGDIAGRAHVPYNTGNNAADSIAFKARRRYTDPTPMDILNPYYAVNIWRRIE
nr:MAG TPA: baseplate protein [Caudoviricetes sp.]